MKTKGTNLLLLTVSAIWSSSRWPLATLMSYRRQRSVPLGGRYRQVSLYHIHALNMVSIIGVERTKSSCISCILLCCLMLFCCTIEHFCSNKCARELTKWGKSTKGIVRGFRSSYRELPKRATQPPHVSKIKTTGAEIYKCRQQRYRTIISDIFSEHERTSNLRGASQFIQPKLNKNRFIDTLYYEGTKIWKMVKIYRSWKWCAADQNHDESLVRPEMSLWEMYFMLYLQTLKKCRNRNIYIYIFIYICIYIYTYLWNFALKRGATHMLKTYIYTFVCHHHGSPVHFIILILSASHQISITANVTCLYLEQCKIKFT